MLFLHTKEEVLDRGLYEINETVATKRSLPPNRKLMTDSSNTPFFIQLILKSRQKKIAESHCSTGKAVVTG
jgi:hypothetical protein